MDSPLGDQTAEQYAIEDHGDEEIYKVTARTARKTQVTACL